ncbi:MAG: LPS export ABC transporter permease LptG [Legionellales bacterium]|nr:LPS export ABC transporter permease LptG [Legionellales bacterium]
MLYVRYIGKNVMLASLSALVILTFIFSFFSLVDQLDATGRGNYGVLQAIQYVLLTVPRLSYELFPIATVIGCMAGLGILANNNELVILRTSGLSKMQLAYALVKIGLIFIIISILIGEVIAPISEQAAQQKRSVALTEQISMKTKNGFWSRDGNSYINIRKILPNEKLEDIRIYEFDKDRQLRGTIHAESADFNNGKWLLYNILRTDISKDKITKYNYKNAEWEALLNPEVISLVTIKPHYLSLRGLINYIDHLNLNNQDSRLYLQALWQKALNPLMILLMMVLAVCVVRCDSITVGLGQRVFVGVLLGIIFHLANQISRHLGIVYDIPIFISVSSPTIIVSLYVIYNLRSDH